MNKVVYVMRCKKCGYVHPDGLPRDYRFRDHICPNCATVLTFAVAKG